MRSISVALGALIGLVAANPAEWPRNAHPPYPTGVTTSAPDTITYVTETICPVTYTHGTEVKTTLTTSTITVTSCKGGCHGPTPPPVYVPGGDKTITKTYTTITYTFVPCSTSVGQNDHSIIYSTYLSQSAITKTYTTYEVVKPTPPPVVIPVPEGPKPGTCPPTVTTITQVVDYFSCPPVPAPVTSTVTVTVGGPKPPVPCNECVKTYTITEGDYTTCITYTYEQPPTKPTETANKPPHPPYSKPTPPVYTPPVYTPPHGTGHSTTPYYPKPTGGYTKGW